MVGGRGLYIYFYVFSWECIFLHFILCMRSSGSFLTPTPSINTTFLYFLDFRLTLDSHWPNKRSDQSLKYWRGYLCLYTWFNKFTSMQYIYKVFIILYILWWKILLSWFIILFANCVLQYTPTAVFYHKLKVCELYILFWT